MSKPNFPPFPVIKTERLVLRALVDKDAQNIFDMRSDAINRRYLNDKLAETIEDARIFMDKIYSGIVNNKWVYWGIALEGKEELIGTICYWNFSEDGEQAELGVELMASMQGKGYMQEAFKAVLGYGIETLELSKIVGHTNMENEKSINLMKRNGFQLKEQFKEKYKEKSGVYTMGLFALTIS